MIARHHRDILIRGTENIGKIGKVFSLVAEMTLTAVGMRLRIRAKLLKLFGAGEGNRTLVFSLEVSKYCNVFSGRSDIFQLFDPLRSLRNFSLSEWRLRAPWSQSKPVLRLYGNP